MEQIKKLASEVISRINNNVDLKDISPTVRALMLQDLSRIKKLCTAETKLFPKGFDSWHETHYQIVEFILGYMGNYNIVDGEDEDTSEIGRKYGMAGSAGLMELAAAWTTAFEKQYEHSKWIVSDWYDTVQQFCNDKNNSK